jgi:hypothetical protein
MSLAGTAINHALFEAPSQQDGILHILSPDVAT